MKTGWQGWVAAALVAACPAGVAAQTSGLYEGAVTAHLGASTGGDVQEASLTPGVSVTVFEPDGWGAEVDLGHTRAFDAGRFVESGITSLTFNVARTARAGRVRPYVVAGGGLLRVRGCVADCVRETSRTDWALDAGAGASVSVRSNVLVRGEVRYFRLVQRHDDLPLRAGGFFDFWRTSIGVTLTWPFGW